jgi:hypothetical protein
LNKHSIILGWLRFATPTRPRHAVDGVLMHGFHVLNKVSCDQSPVSLALHVALMLLPNAAKLTHARRFKHLVISIKLMNNT